MIEEKAKVAIVSEVRRGRQEADTQEFVLPREPLNHFRNLSMLRRTILADQDLPIAWRLGSNTVEQVRKLSRAVEGGDADGKSLRHS
jgi:hypothetical protein